jgi:hypothetical protein
MRTLSLDISKARTGWTTRVPRQVECGSYRPSGDSHGEIFADYLSWLRRMVAKHADTPEPIRFVAIERVLPGNVGGFVDAPKGDLIGGPVFKPTTNFDTQFVLYGLHAITQAELWLANIPFLMATPGEWRASYFGRGTKPPKELKGSKRSKWWKDLALQKADEFGVVVTDSDSAESYGLSCWLNVRLQQERFKRMAVEQQQGTMP